MDPMSITEFGLALKEILKLSEQEWTGQRGRRKPNRRALDSYNQLIYLFSPLKTEQLRPFESLQKEKKDELRFQSGNQYLFLPPIEEEVSLVPLMSLKLLFNRQVSQLKICVLFLSMDENKPKYHIGFRLECPESQNQGQENPEPIGVHDFYHAQLITELDGAPIQGPEWLPVSQPSFPLVANCPVTLFLCLLLSIYGKKRYISFIINTQSQKIKINAKKISEFYGWK
jgi:hypothetical protein